MPVHLPSGVHPRKGQLEKRSGRGMIETIFTWICENPLSALAVIVVIVLGFLAWATNGF